MTLIELLVVISIMIILAVIIVPNLEPAMESRQIREAARAVNVYFGSARTKAIETGRPVGVIIQRYEYQLEAGYVLRQAEVPPPYAGDTLDAKLQLQGLGQLVPKAGYQRGQYDLEFLPNGSSAMWKEFVRDGDVVQFNYQGPLYEVTFLTNKNQNDWYKRKVQLLDVATGRPVQVNTGANGLPFQLFRQPVPTAAAPLQLPRGVVIDLAASGTDPMLSADVNSGNSNSNSPDWWERSWTFAPNPKSIDPNGPQYEPPRPVVIMFSPNGSLDRMFYYQNPRYPAAPFGQYVGPQVVAPVHLLVGKWERMRQEAWNGQQPPTPPPAMAEDGLYNYQDLTNLWVTINAQTGLVTVAEVYGNAATGGNVTVPRASGDLTNNSTNPGNDDHLFVSRRFAREGQVSLGGR